MNENIDAGRDEKGQPLRLAVRRVSKRYGGVQALDEVSFELRAGEIMALLGENGAGKSTLVKVLAGLVEPDAGELFVDGSSATFFPAAASQAAGVAVVHQEFSSVPSLTVAENLALGAADRTGRVWWPPTLAKQARPLLDRVGLDHLDPRQRVETLSVAEQQLLEIARVLARDAKVVIFDEPTAALSDREIARVLQTIQSLAAEGRSIIYVTHRLPEVFHIADRATVVRNGRTREAVRVEDVTPDAVISMILGRQLSNIYPPRREVPDGNGFPVVLEVADVLAEGLRRPVTLSVSRGEILGLAGQLGSGCSSVTRALAGMIPATAGRMSLCGTEITRTSHAHRIRHGIAYCSGDRKLDGMFADKPVYQNMSSPWLSSISRAGWLLRRHERVQAERHASAFTVDTRRMTSAVGVLSGGNQQKVALGKWLGINPKVVLVEEPTRGVDVGARSEIYSRLRELSDQGTAVVVVSSDTAELHGLCDRVATFYRGAMTQLRTSAEWTEDQLVLEVMHNPDEVLR
ncbi:sugar ABC transporter ATP-binding protein [Amycolatopsis pithecellobii]|uniref:ATP-binding cassette domain-containing protein n=1 Tax=Amycolatopsis pithecellobii TaxID=664692 RepID=A0A6N7ZBG4_9PSEU|nr:sugar ABC transporter ATP-binding protein [Amycolatopsis pithecellobii]MTD59114.1 ATP-binding cassette domain-containing protein [Amycolatopsis pithecellobii]